MSGSGHCSDLPDSLLNPKTNVLAYYDGQVSNPAYACKMAKLNGHLGTEFGPEITFGLDMEQAYPNDNIALIKWAYGSTDLANDWNPAQTGNCYEKFKNTVISQMAALSQNYQPVIVGMLWMQGEADAYNSQAEADAYEQNLRNFISSVKTDFSRPDLKFVIGRIDDSSAWTYSAPVRAAEVTVANDTANTTWINTDDITRWDLYHFDSTGLLTLGHRFATAMEGLIPGDPAS